jgi:hypothetical protein
MGKRSAVVELFLGDMGSMQREDQLTMETKLEQIEVKAVNQLPKRVVREIATFCGSRGDPVGGEKSSSLPPPSGRSDNSNGWRPTRGAFRLPSLGAAKPSR